MKYLILWISCAFSFASPTLDDLYSLKTFNVGVINPTGEPIYVETVQDAMLGVLRLQKRAEFNETAYLFLKRKLEETKIPPVKEPTPEKLAPLNGLIQEQYSQGVRALILAEIIPGEDNYYISIMLFATKNAELLYQSKMPVDNRFYLDSFAAATRSALNEIFKQIPFDGSVLSREGYRVVIDRGRPALKPGMQLPVYTIQLDGSSKVLEETGTIILTQVDDSMAFGRILVEKKPLEITANNKIRLGGDLPLQWKIGGEYAPVENNNQAFQGKRRYGFVDVQLSGLLMNLSNSTSSGGGLTAQNNFYPGGLFKSEIWITNAFFFDVGFAFASSSFSLDSGGSTYNLNSVFSDMRAQVGYRVYVTPSEYGSYVHFKIGFMRQNFGIDTTPDPLTFSSNTSAGVLISAGAKFPVNDRLGFGFDVGTVLFGSLTESPITSGTPTDLTIWDASLRAYFAISTNMELSAKAIFQSLSCNFTGTGTRVVPLSNMNELGKALTLGISYYF